MKKIHLYTTFLLACTFLLAACSDDETYAEQKEKERKAINSFIRRNVILLSEEGDTICDVGRINPISEATFEAQDSTTDLANNEYVLFKSSGISMQIVRKGAGEKLRSGESKRIICRFVEYNILGDSIQLRSDVPFWGTNPDILDVTNISGSISGTFNTLINNGGALFQTYHPQGGVPRGWLVPLSYINIGRQVNPNEGIAKVRLIVPHSEGHSAATTAVYPCFYEITYQEMRD